MNYILELNTQKQGSNIVFNTIIFDSFKVNIVERYNGKMGFNQKLGHILFKVRTLGDEIINTRNGHLRIKIKNNEFDTYQKLINVINSYDYKNKLINIKTADHDYVNFMLGLVISNYQLS